MKRLLTRSLIAFTLLLPAAWAQAAITCTISSLGFSTAYGPTNPAVNITQASFTVTCQRNLAGDPTSITYQVAVDNGVNAQGQQNRARLGATASLIQYDTFRDSACSQLWKVGGNRITDTIPVLTGFTPASKTTSFWGCVPALQGGLPAGTYTDIVTMTLSTGATNTFPVSIFTPATCTITSPPGNVVFTYTAFGGAQAASTSYGVTCTNFLPYTMALDATVGVVSGLQYTLALSASAATGTGLQQGYTINGTMPAGQAGTCATASCVATQTRTLTVTY